MSAETLGQALRRLRMERRLSLRKLQILTRYDYSYLGQVERGEKAGSLEVAKGCDAALGLAGELVAIYRQCLESAARSSKREDDMRRRPVIKLLAAAPLIFKAEFAGGPESQATGLERHAEIYRHLYHGAGDPLDLLGLTRDHLDGSADVLRGLSGGPLKQRVLRSRSEVAMLAGRLAFSDLHDATQARGFYGLAYEAATQAGDDALAAVAIGHLAFLPAREGNTAAAVDYLGGAVAHARRTGAPAINSWTAAVESELLATDNPEASLHAIDRAESLFDGQASEPPPAWFDYYSSERLTGFHGYALLKTGLVDEARAVLSAALDGLAPGALKQRAVFLLDIATSHILGKAPDIDCACDLATMAVDSLCVAGYATGVDRLREFRVQARSWDHTSAVRALDERLGQLKT